VAVTNLNEPGLPLFRAHRAPAGRSWLLSLLCLVGVLAVALAWYHALWGETARAFGPGFWPSLAVTSAALLAAVWGVWRLRRWALWAFPLALLLDDGLAAAMGELHWPVVAFQAASALVLLAHRSAFRRDAARSEQQP
jgi:hypothetical protein